MSVIARNKPFEQVGVAQVLKTALTGADTLTYSTAVSQALYIENTTGAAVTITVDGDGGTTFAPGGIGTTINVAGGFAIAVPAGQTVCVALRNISQYLKGAVAVTGGAAGVNAWIQE